MANAHETQLPAGARSGPVGADGAGPVGVPDAAAQPGSLGRFSTILAVTVAALGYFVDIFDLLLFAMVRKDSLKEVLGERLA
ncbi:MAG: hypothetical protein RJA05_1, partial [Planctomycetota bacterium]